MTGKIHNLALIGAGGMGKRWVKAIQKVEKVNLVKIIDADLSRAQALAKDFPGCIALSEWQSSMKDKEIDVVLVVTPHKFLSETTLGALNHKKHVLTEKPGATSSRDVLKAIKLSRKNNLCYMVGFNHRFHEAYIKAREAVNASRIGEVIFVRARYGFGGRIGYEKEWRMNKKVSGGGELIDQGVHMIELACSFIGIPQEVKGFAQDTFWNSKVDDNAFVLLKNKKKLASIHVSLTQWKPIHNFEVYGTNGYVSIEGLGRRYGGTEKITIGKRNEDFTDSCEETIITCNPDADNSLVLELKEFISAIEQKRIPIPSGAEAYNTLKIIEKIYKNK